MGYAATAWRIRLFAAPAERGGARDTSAGTACRPATSAAARRGDRDRDHAVRLLPWRATDRWGLVALVAWVTWVLVFAVVLLVALAGCARPPTRRPGHPISRDFSDAPQRARMCDRRTVRTRTLRQNFTIYSDFVEPALGELSRFHHGQWPSVAAQRDHQLANPVFGPSTAAQQVAPLMPADERFRQLVGHLRAVAEGEGFQIGTSPCRLPSAAFVSRCRNAGKVSAITYSVTDWSLACITYIVTGQCGYTTSSATDWFSSVARIA